MCLHCQRNTGHFWGLPAEKRVELFKKLVSIEEILHENSDFIFETLRLRTVYYWLTVIYQGMDCPKNKDFGDYENTALCAKGILITKEIFAPVREHERFKAIIAELDKHIKTS
jgi:hypothetical protein